MTKNVATVEDLNAIAFLGLLEHLGYALRHPDFEYAVGFSQEGDEIHLNPQDVPNFLIENSGVVLWRGASESLYLAVALGKPRVFFDGLSSTEEAKFCSSLSAMDVRFSVAHQDSAFEA